MESLCDFLQNDSKFFEILVVTEISQFEVWQVAPFFAKTRIFDGAYLQNCCLDCNKIKNLGGFTWALPANQFLCKSVIIGLSGLKN